VHDKLLAVLRKAQGVEGALDAEAGALWVSPVEAMGAGERLLFCNTLPVIPIALLALLFQVSFHLVIATRQLNIEAYPNTDHYMRVIQLRC
jgi:hypothetical protein